MCLIAFAYRQHPQFPLVFAGNRDESYRRSTRKAQFWYDHPDVLAGKDLEGGGTWLGVTRGGKFSTVTNFRDPSIPQRNGPSRGELVLEYLAGSESAESFIRRLHPTADAYNGFNLLVGGVRELYYFNNFDNKIQKLEPGIYGLSNHKLNNEWPKVQKAKKRLTQIINNTREQIDPESLFDLLYDEQPADKDELPDTGLTREQERKVSPVFIETEKYGTRSSTVVLIREDGKIYFDERYHERGQKELSRALFELRIKN